MTSTILFLTLLALLVLLIVAYRGDFAEPSILFVVGFTLAVFNGLTNYRTWDFDLSMQTCFVVGFGTFAFALTAYGVKVFFRSCVGHRTAHREYGEPQDIVLPMWVYVGGLLFTGLALLIVSRQIISLTLPYGGDGSLDKAIGLYDKLNKFSTKGVALSGIPSLLHLATNAMAYAWLFLAMRSVVVRSLHNDYLAVINVLAAVPMTLISGGRNSLIQLGVAAWTYWALFRRQNNRWKGMRLGFRTVLKFVAIALVGLASFKPLLSLMGRKAGDSTMYEYLSIYIGAPIKNLDAYLTNSMSPSLAVKSTQWGDMTLASTRASFPQIFGKTVLDWMQWQPFQRYGERSLGNVFTTYYAFIFDWGIAGAMLAIVLIAALSQLCYESAVFALQYGKAGIPISMMLYGAIGYCCAFSFFSNRWMSTMFNQIMLRNIIIWVVLIFFVNSVRTRKRAFAKRVVLYV